MALAVMMLDTGVFRQWNVLIASSLILIIPVILVFFLMQKILYSRPDFRSS